VAKHRTVWTLWEVPAAAALAAHEAIKVAVTRQQALAARIVHMQTTARSLVQVAQLACVVLEQPNAPQELLLWRMRALPLMQVGCWTVNLLKIVLDKPLCTQATATKVSLGVQRMYAMMTATAISPQVNEAHPPDSRQRAEGRDTVTGASLLDKAAEALLQAAPMRMRVKSQESWTTSGDRFHQGPGAPLADHPALKGGGLPAMVRGA